MLNVPYIQSGKEKKALEHMTRQTLQSRIFFSLKFKLAFRKKKKLFLKQNLVTNKNKK